MKYLFKTMLNDCSFETFYRALDAQMKELAQKINLYICLRHNKKTEDTHLLYLCLLRNITIPQPNSSAAFYLRSKTCISLHGIC